MSAGGLGWISRGTSKSRRLQKTVMPQARGWEALKAKQVPVGIFGFGRVGRELVRLIEVNREFHRANYGLEFQVNMVADSRGFLFSGESTALSTSTLQRAVEWKESGEPLYIFKDVGYPIMEFKKLRSTFINESSILVDCSASDATTDFLLEQSQCGGAVVFANKKPLTASMHVWSKFYSPPALVGAESTVGAGTPFVATLQALLAGGDMVRRVRGMLSGTMGYIFSGLESGRLFSEVVQDAYKNGFTEPDPRDDLSGKDIARKALIIGRMLGMEMELDELPVAALYPASMEDLSVEDFMTALPSLDAGITEKVEQATKNGSVLRYLASVDIEAETPITVGLGEVDRSSPMGQLKGTDNLLELSTEAYGASPLCVQGAGAGVRVTAQGCLADMVALAQRQRDGVIQPKL